VNRQSHQLVLELAAQVALGRVSVLVPAAAPGPAVAQELVAGRVVVAGQDHRR
jgi:hypothetical protein